MGHKTGVTLQRLVKQSVPPDKDSVEEGGQQGRPASHVSSKPTITTGLDNDNNLRKQKQLSDNLGKNLRH